MLVKVLLAAVELLKNSALPPGTPSATAPLIVKAVRVPADALFVNDIDS